MIVCEIAERGLRPRSENQMVNKSNDQIVKLRITSRLAPLELGSHCP